MMVKNAGNCAIKTFWCIMFISFNFAQCFKTSINTDLTMDVPDDPGVDVSVQDAYPLTGLLEP
jgi:hypothetical protein